MGRGSGLQMGSTSLIGDSVQSSCQGAIGPLLVWRAVRQLHMWPRHQEATARGLGDRLKSRRQKGGG